MFHICCWPSSGATHILRKYKDDRMEMTTIADINSCVTSQALKEGTDVRNEENTDVRNTLTNGTGDYDADSEFAALGDQRNTATCMESCENETSKPHPKSGERIFISESSSYKPFQFLRRRRGLVLTSLASICLSFQGVFLDILTETLDSFQVVFMYVPILVICCFVIIIYRGVRPTKNYKHYIWLLACGICQAGTGCFFTLSLTYLAVGDAVSILYTALIQVGFFSWIILKEPVRMFDIVFAILAFGGVIFIARPNFIFQSLDDSSSYDVTLLGVLYCLVGSCTFAMSIVLNKNLSKLGMDSIFCMFFVGTVILCVSGFVSVILNRWRCPSTHDWLFVLLAGVTWAVSYFSVFYALKVETATHVTMLITTEIVWAFLWQVIFIRMTPFWTSYIGAILILTACIGITLKNKPRLPQSRDSRVFTLRGTEQGQTM